MAQGVESGLPGRASATALGGASGAVAGRAGGGGGAAAATAGVGADAAAAVGVGLRAVGVRARAAAAAEGEGGGNLDGGQVFRRGSEAGRLLGSEAGWRAGLASHLGRLGEAAVGRARRTARPWGRNIRDAQDLQILGNDKGQARGIPALVIPDLSLNKSAQRALRSATPPPRGGP